ncbi:MAG TPA: SPOR domain-containing protein [Cytophagaceae bacterium]|jgi:hypothetical protein|nr:SPOR domain-containing protein [Cytophagaceae bacterium]
MSIESHIQKLLFEHNCVVIPNFGGFISEYKGVEIHPITHRFTVPSKRIAFNEQLKANDGLLATTIAKAEGKSIAEANECIKNFVASIREELRVNNNYVFYEIGKLFYNIDHKLEFEPDARVNYLEESFGFQELFFKPIDRKLSDMSTPQRPVRPVVRKQIPTSVQSQKEKISSPQEEPNKGSGLKMVLIIIPLLLLVGVGAMIVYTKNNNKNLASFNIFGSNNNKVSKTEAPKSASTVDSVALSDSSESLENPSNEISTVIGEGNPEVPEVDENPAKQTLIDKQKELSENTTTENPKEDIGSVTAHHGRYFVIVGSFISKENAYKLRNKVAKTGSNVTVLEPTPDNKFYKVAINDYDNKEDALKKKNELSSDFGNSVWVMVY